MTWYKEKDFDQNTNEFFDWLFSDIFFCSTNKLIKDHFKGLDINVSCINWKGNRNKILEFSTTYKNTNVDIVRIRYSSNDSGDNPIISIYSELTLTELIRFINKFQKECDNFFLISDQRTIDERINKEKFENEVRKHFLSSFLSKN